MAKEPKTKPTGRKPIPSHLQAEKHEPRPSACADSGETALDVVDELIEEKLHVVKEHQRRLVVRRFTCRCRVCGARTTLRSLPAPYERSKVTCEWLAWLVYQKFWLLTPLDRIRRDLTERGVPVAVSTLVTLIERASELLSGIDGLHWRQLLAGPWMATDGTGLKVHEADKASDAVVAKLQPFRGTLTADGEHRFNAVYTSGRVLEAGCNAHGRRKFRDAKDTQPVLATEGGAFIGAIYSQRPRVGRRRSACLRERAPRKLPRPTGSSRAPDRVNELTEQLGVEATAHHDPNALYIGSSWVAFGTQGGARPLRWSAVRRGGAAYREHAGETFAGGIRAAGRSAEAWPAPVLTRSIRSA